MLSEYYLMSESISNGCKADTIERLLPSVKKEIASMRPMTDLRLLGGKSIAEVSSDLIGVLARLQHYMFGIGGPEVAAQLVLALAYLRRDPEFADIILDFYVEVEPRKRGRPKKDA